MNNYHIETICPICRKHTTINVNLIDYRNWNEGRLLIQQAFPYLSENEREMLISGVCPSCWDNIFNEEDEAV